MAKLMLVEDDNNLREIYEARLQAEGYTIVSARDGEEALVVAKAEKPDLVISDVMMPKISGFEMLDILRNTEGLKHVKVIMLTALGQSDDQQRADRLGADRYLVKSQVTLEDIVKVAHELLQDQPGGSAGPSASAAPPAAPEPPAPPAPQAPAAPPAVTAPAPSPAPDPASVPEPAPAPEPQAAPAAAPVVAEPVAAPAPSAEVAQAAVNDTTPQSEASESAALNEQIENFVAGATQEAGPAPQAPAPSPAPDPASVPGPAPAPEPQAAPAMPVAEPPAAPVPAQTPVPASEPSAAPAAPTQASDDQAADDKLVAEAAQHLADSTPNEAKDSPAPAPSETPPAAPAPDAAKEGSENVPIAHKKVIEPPETPPKKDINTLLAEEQAKEAAQNPASAEVVSGDGGNKGDKIDPHSVAL